jgi:general secretion pathway protein A
MVTADLGLQKLPFHSHGRPLVFVHYCWQREAHQFLCDILRDRGGVGLLYGPESSGKTTLVSQFARGLPANIAVSMIDGTRLKPAELLQRAWAGFGFAHGTSTENELLKILTLFVRHQARKFQPPVLIVENINRMYPAALSLLCQLAALRTQQGYALRLILVSSNAAFSIVHAPAMYPLSSRMLGAFQLGPLTAAESVRYLHAKLRASEFTRPEELLPEAVCYSLYRASGGWPGHLDRLAQRALAKQVLAPRDQLQARGSQPAVTPSPSAVSQTAKIGSRTLFLTLNGKTLQAVTIKESKFLIGRSKLCDLHINSRFISKFHAMLVRSDDALYLVDLKSSNGSFVNSKRVQIQALRHDDVIALGNHGIKLISPDNSRRPQPQPKLADTAKMKALADLRRQKELRESIISLQTKKST